MEGIENYRRVGGSFDGRLHRSGHFHHATTTDREALRRLDLGLIVDLRRPAERRAAPSPSLDIRTLADDRADASVSPHLGFLTAGDLRPEAIEAYLLGYYQAAPFSPALMPLFASLLEELEQGQRSVLVHCTAGKDRTGLAVAIAQIAAGATHEAVTAEYLRSNASLAHHAFRAAKAAEIEAICGFAPSDFVIDSFAGVRPQYLEAALNGIEWAGGMAAYLDRLRHELPARDCGLSLTISRFG